MITFANVDFPLPLGPIKTTTSPSLMFKLILSRIFRPSFVLTLKSLLTLDKTACHCLCGLSRRHGCTSRHCCLFQDLVLNPPLHHPLKSMCLLFDIHSSFLHCHESLSARGILYLTCLQELP